jgi:hypothetical protein
MPHDLEPVIDDEWLGSPDSIATAQAMTGYSADDLYYFGGYDPAIVRHSPETIIHDARDELACVLDNEGILVTPELVVEAARIISKEPKTMVDYLLPELFTGVRRIGERDAAFRPLVGAGSSPLPLQASEGSAGGKRIVDQPTPEPERGKAPNWEELLLRFLEDEPQYLPHDTDDRPLLPRTEPTELFSTTAMTAVAR